jgi:hypothetical protein
MTELLLLFALACPSCPTQQAARALFFADDVLVRIGGTLGPFVATAALIGLFVRKLQVHARRRGAESPAPAATEDES